MYPGSAVGGDQGRVEGGRLVWNGEEADKVFRGFCVGNDRIDGHLREHVLLECWRKHEINPLLGQGAVLSTCEDADKLNLAEAGFVSQNCAGERLLDRRFYEDKFEGDAGTIRDDQRTRSTPIAEFGVVGALQSLTTRSSLSTRPRQ